MMEYVYYKPRRPTNRILNFARGMRRKPTEHEKMTKFALQYIADNEPNIKKFLSVIKNQFCLYSKVGNKWYIVDFYIPELRLVIEVDGNHHVTDKKQVEHDTKRTTFLESIGLSVERIPNRNTLLPDFGNNLKEILHKHIKKQIEEPYIISTSWRDAKKLAKKIKKWKKRKSRKHRNKKTERKSFTKQEVTVILRKGIKK